MMPLLQGEFGSKRGNRRFSQWRLAAAGLGMLFFGGLLWLAPLGCSKDTGKEPDLSIEDLGNELLHAVAAVQEAHPDTPSIAAGDLLEAVLKSHGRMDVVGGEKWEDVKVRLAREHREYLIPVAEVFAAKCRASTELQRDGGRPLTEEEKAKAIQAHLTRMGAFVRPEMETNAVIAWRSLDDLQADWLMKTPEDKRFTKEIRAATPDRGYHGYWFKDCGNGGFMAIPCEYGKTAIYTLIATSRTHAIYRKDLGGSVLTEIPENPEKEGWVEIEINGKPKSR
jgi:hypothetical protein